MPAKIIRTIEDLKRGWDNPKGWTITDPRATEVCGNDKVEVSCFCGKVSQKKVSDLLNAENRGCRSCANKSRKLKWKELKARVPQECRWLIELEDSQVVSVVERIPVSCTCEAQVKKKIVLNEILRGKSLGCGLCAERRVPESTIGSLIRQLPPNSLWELQGDLSKRVGLLEHVSCICKGCGEEGFPRADTLIDGDSNGCKECSHEVQRSTGKQISKKLHPECQWRILRTEFKKGFSVGGKIRAQCKCGNIDSVNVKNLQDGISTQCKACKNFAPVEKSIEELKASHSFSTSYWTVLDWTPVLKAGAYKVFCRCVCGNERHVSIRSLKSTELTSCGCLNASKGELLIVSALKKLGVDYKHRHYFEDCRSPRSSRTLEFDFFLPSEGSLIEYHGQQHFKEIEYFKQSLKDRQYFDSLRREFAKDSGYRLLEIKYVEKEREARLKPIIVDFLKSGSPHVQHFL
jgi:hypothetical protein